MKHRIVIGSIWAVAAALPAAGQSPGPAMRQPASAPRVEMPIEVAPEGQPPVRMAAVESRVTTGRPYSAEATTEFTQVLGDGNRIARKTTVRIYRDAEGRTRREQLEADGTVKSISIYDPVAHVSFVLDPATRTAYKSPVRIVYPTPVMAEKIGAERETSARLAGKIVVTPMETPEQAAAEGMRKRQVEIVAHATGAGALQPAMRGAHGAKTDTLGQKLIDGVPADGSRTTTVIPAGSIGNQQEITVVAEQWFSPDLEILLMTRHSDPRSGETSYRLSNIVRAEPPAGTFDVPAEYTIKESSYSRQPAVR